MYENNDDIVSAESQYLIKFIDISDYKFVRNGKVYDSHKAAEHLRMKFRYAKSHIHTTEDFIKYCGSRSSVTKKPYLVIDQSGKTHPLADVLLKELQSIRSHQI